jgi:hypothetical protein
MKTRNLKALLVMSLAVSSVAFAQEDGRMRLEMHHYGSGGRLFVEARQEGDRIVGYSSFSSDRSINLKVQPGVSYKGAAAGGYTDLSCGATSCQGVIGDKSAQFSFDATSQRGSFNFNRLRITRSAGRIVIDSLGALDLKETSPGNYEGRGFLNNAPGSSVWAELETSGSLQGLTDPALLTILVAGAIVGP